MPLTGAFTVVYSRFSSACLTIASRLLHARLGRRRHARASPSPARGAVCAVLQFGGGLLLAGARLRQPALAPRGSPASASATCASRGFGRGAFARRPRPPPRRTAAARSRPSPAAASSRSTSCAAFVAFASASRCRACAVDEPRLRATSMPCSRLDDRGLGLLDAALRRRHVARRRRRRDRHAGSRRDRRRFGVGELGARRVERDLVVARIDLDEHGARLDLLVVVDRHAQHRAADARRNRRHMRIHLRIVGRLAPARRSTTRLPTPIAMRTATPTMNPNTLCSFGYRASEVLGHRLFGRAEGSREQGFRDVEAVERGDVLLARQRDGLLRLHDFDVDATPAAKRSRDCVSCCAASSRARVAVCSCFLGRLADRGTPCARRSRSRPSRPRLRRACVRSSTSAWASRPWTRPPSKIGTLSAPVMLKVGSDAADVQADRAVVGGHPHRRQCLADDGPPRMLRRPARAPAPPDSRAARGTRARAPPRASSRARAQTGAPRLSSNACPSGRPMTRASCSLVFSKSLVAAVTRWRSVISRTSARTTSIPATRPLCRRPSAC